MTASTASTLPSPTGTAFVHKVFGESGHVEPFYAREPGRGDLAFEPEPTSPAQQETNAKVLRRIALDVLSESRLGDPNVRYAHAVHAAVVSQLHGADRITSADADNLSASFNIAVEYAAKAVATAWLRERGSIPIADDEPSR